MNDEIDKSVTAFESSIDAFIPKAARPYVLNYALWRDIKDWQEKNRRERPEDYK